MQNKGKNKNNAKVFCRSLKIATGYLESKAIGVHNRTTTRVPFIRLRGKWLENLGFEEGGRVQIVSSKNLLIITPEKEETDYNEEETTK